MCEGRAAIVTEASGSGMGRSIALTLAREGAKVAVNYRRSEESARAIVNYIRSRDGVAVALQADVFEADGCKKLVDTTVERFGQVDICIVGPGGGWHPEPVDRLDPTAALEDVHHEIAPLYYLMPLVLPEMYKRKWGKLVGIALHPTNLPPAYSYNVGKAARTQALLLAQEQTWQSGVTINVIAPSPVPAIRSLDEAIEQCEHGRAWQKRTTTSPQDIAESVAFLCSEAGRFITGCVLPFR
ncbi:MAG: SDR family oxidoreductase [Candidatus Bathyarchaeota archaeon]|nr:SDR family oxidoreductase [Candidatus Bathyarchaeota archaeon]